MPEQGKRVGVIVKYGDSELKQAKRVWIILLTDVDLGTMAITAGWGASTMHGILARHRIAPHRLRLSETSTGPNFREKVC